ncbi:hypothetical protein CC79DRAFT_576496 [Sarocladium strictum]
MVLYTSSGSRYSRCRNRLLASWRRRFVLGLTIEPLPLTRRLSSLLMSVNCWRFLWTVDDGLVAIRTRTLLLILSRSCYKSPRSALTMMYSGKDLKNLTDPLLMFLNSEPRAFSRRSISFNDSSTRSNVPLPKRSRIFCEFVQELLIDSLLIIQLAAQRGSCTARPGFLVSDHGQVRYVDACKHNTCDI